MTTKEQLERAYKLLKDRWANEGGCASCGWHAELGEHFFDDVDVATALEGNGVLHLNCVSPDDEDSHSHRGVKVSLKER